jgi:hypothetical protein
MSTKVRLTTRSAWWDFAKAIAAGQDFDTSGALKGRSGEAPWSWGRLDYDHRASVKDADYVIYSYQTPIAWRTQGQWHTPNVKYSVTTSRHQSKIFTAIDQLLQFT